MWLGCIWCCAMSNDGYDLSRSCSNAQGISISLQFLFLWSVHRIWINIFLLVEWLPAPLFLRGCFLFLLIGHCRSILMLRQNMIWSKIIRFYRKYSTSWKLRRYFHLGAHFSVFIWFLRINKETSLSIIGFWGITIFWNFFTNTSSTCTHF